METWLNVKVNFDNCNRREMHEDSDNAASLRMEEWFGNDGHKSSWAWSSRAPLNLKGNMDDCNAIEVDEEMDRYTGFQTEE